MNGGSFRVYMCMYGEERRGNKNILILPKPMKSHTHETQLPEYFLNLSVITVFLLLSLLLFLSVLQVCLSRWGGHCDR